MVNRDLLKEAIADAKAVKETAIANAKAALEEAFTPYLKEKLAAKLSEMDEMDEAKEMDEMKEKEVKETYETRPDLTMSDIARMYGLASRAHVWWIIHRRANNNKSND